MKSVTGDAGALVNLCPRTMRKRGVYCQVEKPRRRGAVRARAPAFRSRATHTVASIYITLKDTSRNL